MFSAASWGGWDQGNLLGRRHEAKTLCHMPTNSRYWTCKLSSLAKVRTVHSDLEMWWATSIVVGVQTNQMFLTPANTTKTTLFNHHLYSSHSGHLCFRTNLSGTQRKTVKGSSWPGRGCFTVKTTHPNRQWPYLPPRLSPRLSHSAAQDLLSLSLLFCAPLQTSLTIYSNKWS